MTNPYRKIRIAFETYAGREINVVEKPATEDVPDLGIVKGQDMLPELGAVNPVLDEIKTKAQGFGLPAVILLPEVLGTPDESLQPHVDVRVEKARDGKYRIRDISLRA